jgi:hypothetical protein
MLFKVNKVRTYDQPTMVIAFVKLLSIYLMTVSYYSRMFRGKVRKNK